MDQMDQVIRFRTSNNLELTFFLRTSPQPKLPSTASPLSLPTLEEIAEGHEGHVLMINSVHTVTWVRGSFCGQVWKGRDSCRSPQHEVRSQAHYDSSSSIRFIHSGQHHLHHHGVRTWRQSRIHKAQSEQLGKRGNCS